MKCLAWCVAPSKPVINVGNVGSEVKMLLLLLLLIMMTGKVPQKHLRLQEWPSQMYSVDSWRFNDCQKVGKWGAI